jgi:hypothetical protein
MIRHREGEAGGAAGDGSGTTRICRREENTMREEERCRGRVTRLLTRPARVRWRRCVVDEPPSPLFDLLAPTCSYLLLLAPTCSYLLLLAPAPSPSLVSLSPLPLVVRQETELGDRGRNVKWVLGLGSPIPAPRLGRPATSGCGPDRLATLNEDFSPTRWLSGSKLCRIECPILNTRVADVDEN